MGEKINAKLSSIGGSRHSLEMLLCLAMMDLHCHQLIVASGEEIPLLRIMELVSGQGR